MHQITVDLKERAYPIYITSDYEELGNSIKKANLKGKMVVVTDDNVDKVQGEACIKALESHGLEVYKYVVPAGESNKNLDTVNDIYQFLLGLKLDRNAVIIALGGGVVGDMAGFAASTFLRGIHFVQIPTTLLAQADSSVGGKVGVDFMGSKNLIGSFYQPKFVYMNVNTLKTLSKRDLASGLAEVVKHGLIMDKDFYRFIDENAQKIFDYDVDTLQYLAKVNCSIKGHVVEQDEREGGLRAILNFGHTIGHAIESVMDFSLYHGECVSLGIVGVYKMAQFLGMVDEDMVDKVTATLKKLRLPVNLAGLDVEKVYSQMFFDKKIKDNKLTFVLPKAIGEVVITTIEDGELIKRAIRELCI